MIEQRTDNYARQPSSNSGQVDETLTIQQALAHLSDVAPQTRALALSTLSTRLPRQSEFNEPLAIAAISRLQTLLTDPCFREQDTLLALLAQLTSSNRCRQAIERNLETYLALLNSSEPRVSMQAAYLLSRLPARRDAILSHLPELATPGLDVRVQACVLLCQADLSGPASETIQLLKNCLKASEEPLVRLVAALILARQQRQATSARAARVLMLSLARPERVAAAYDELPWTVGSLVSEVCQALRYLRPSLLQFAIPTLIETLGQVSSYNAMSIVQTLLFLAFHEQTHGAGLVATELTGTQRLVLMAVDHSLNTWNTMASPDNTLAPFGLESLRGRLAG